MEKLLFTGASGFLGNNIRLLLHNEYKTVHTLGLSLDDDVQINLVSAIPQLEKHYDIVLHACGKAHTVPRTDAEKKVFYDVNYQGTVNLCTALEKVGAPKSLIFISTVAVYGCENGEMITVADIPNIDMNVRQLDIKEFIENTENKYPEIYKLFNYYTERDYKIYSEIGMFLPKWRISGTIDILCLREDSCIIGDWKTNRGGLKFTAGYYKKDKSTKPAQTTNIWVPKSEFLLPPLNNLPACNGSVYNMQLSLYAFGVEWILGIPCRGMWLCHIDSDFELNKYGMPKRFEDGLYHIKENPVEKCTIHPMKYLREEVLGILKDRETVLQAENVTKELNLFD